MDVEIHSLSHVLSTYNVYLYESRYHSRRFQGSDQSFATYNDPSLNDVRYNIGDRVYVTPSGHGTIEKTPSTLGLPPDHEWYGRYRIAFDVAGKYAHIREPVLCSVPNRPAIMITPCTEEYRRFARSQLYPSKDSSVVEIGCSTGMCSALLAKHSVGGDGRSLIGFDVGEEMVAAAKRQVPQGTFLVCDVAQHPEALQDIVKERTVDVLFIDIGGNRPMSELSAVLLRAVPILKPSLIVIKNEDLASIARTTGTPSPTCRNHVINASPQWWGSALTSTVVQHGTVVVPVEESQHKGDAVLNTKAIRAEEKRKRRAERKEDSGDVHEV